LKHGTVETLDWASALAPYTMKQEI